MPQWDLGKGMDVMETAGTIQFSAVRPANLGASEYTLVAILCDISGSVYPFKDKLRNCIKKVIDCCKRSDRSENLMIAFWTFNDIVEEVHGFRELDSIDVDDYEELMTSGLTALHDAVHTGIDAIATYANTLAEQDFDVNACVYIITDGDDNHSSRDASDVKKLTSAAMRSEKLESLVSVLIGLKDAGVTDDNWAENVGRHLSDFQGEAGLTKYVDVGDATESQLAQLGEFISQSISSQSQRIPQPKHSFRKLNF